MIIADKVDVRLEICDIETLAEFVDIGCYNPDTGKWTEFEISRRKNDLYKFIKWYKSKPCDFMVTFNGIGFDQVILQFICEESHNWFDLSGQEVATKVYEFVQRHIDDQKYKIQPKYKESSFPIRALDLFKIHHFDNEARRTSLKWCAFMMNMSVEEMPIHHSTKGLTDQQMDEVISYRRNDCRVTEGLLYLTLGQIDKLEKMVGSQLPELRDYSGKNKIQDRYDVMAETGLNCLNWSDVTIGEEWNKNDYKIAEGLEDDKGLFTKKITKIYGRKFSDFFPHTMKFETEHLRNFINDLGNNYVLAIKQEFKINIDGTEYTIAKGGIHSNEKNRRLIPPKGWLLRDADVGSQYPSSILKYSIYPPHLKSTIIEQFDGKVKKRFSFKDMAKKLIKEGKDILARPYSSVQEMLKLCLNGGYYGKLNQNGSFLEHPEGYLKVCMGNQIEILMLIEDMVQAGFKVVSGNTDGIVVMFPEEKEDLYKKICSDWEKQVGNNLLGKLEYTDFTSMWQENINHYIGLKIDGKVKKKGRFMTEFELNKNKGKRVIALALEAYFIHGKNPIEFIKGHKNIFDFCIAKKATGQLHYEEIISDEKVIKHKKLIRYYVSDDGHVFMKRGINNEGDLMNNHCEATDKDFPWMGQPLLQYFNTAKIEKDFSKYKINYSYYILETLKRIDKIEKTKKAAKYADLFKTEQLSFF